MYMHGIYIYIYVDTEKYIDLHIYMYCTYIYIYIRAYTQTASTSRVRGRRVLVMLGALLTTATESLRFTGFRVTGVGSGTVAKVAALFSCNWL